MRKMNAISKAAFLMILTYLLVQLLPILISLFFSGSIYIALSLIIFGLGTLSMFVIERKYHMFFPFELPYQGNQTKILIWGVLGSILIILVQFLASIFEMSIFGLPPSSTDTQIILEVLRQYPVYILFVSVFSPIMEEFIFRKAIGGILVERIGWIGASVISSLLFAIVHFNGHYLIYAASSLVLSYLYYKTGNLITPIISHMLLNTVLILFYIIPI